MKLPTVQPILSLKPTQFALGMLEIRSKVKELKRMSRKQLKKEIKSHVVPVIMSPWRDLYAIDHHHFLFAAWQSGIRKVQIKLVKDYSGTKMTGAQFWRKLATSKHVRLFDQFGQGPRIPLYLPEDIRGCADDPYRSLAWSVRERGGYKNTSVPFAEFDWADFFRSTKLLDKTSRRGMKQAILKGLTIASDKGASRLPGYQKKRLVPAPK